MRAGARLLGLLLLVVAGLAAAQQASDLSGMSGVEIKALQQRLAADGCYAGAIDEQQSPALADAIKACPSQDPILRIETGMHLAKIKRIAVDSACHFAVTGSYDKTARLWSLPDGRLLRTLRVPIGTGSAGWIYATAVSPDRHWIAVGGSDAEWDTAHEEYVSIFDFATGALVAHVGSFGNVINHLTFSPDGRWLAAVSGARVGLKVIDTRTWNIVVEDKNYGGESYGAAFAPDGRLYTVALDGKLRQYGPGPAFALEKETNTRGGSHPVSVAVDPRGELVAIGIYGARKADIYDARTLQFRAGTDTTDVRKGFSPYLVAWSSDSERLVVGTNFEGQAQGTAKTLLLTFNRNGRRVRSLLPLGNDTIGEVSTCGNGFAFSMGSSFGLVDGNGQISLLKSSVAADMRGKFGDAFAISPDARRVRFGLGFGDDQPVVFDLSRATLADASSPMSKFITSSVRPSASLERALSPILAQDNEVPIAAASNDQSGLVVGATFSLFAYDAQGRLLWRQTAPEAVSGVNLSPDGRIVVAAYEDGTIRWHRWSDGKELLALFVDRKTKAWVAWTPTGYYMASPGGEDLIGWHVNRGWNQAADFFPASRFRDRFNRPDIVQRVLTTLDEGEAIRQANEAARRKADTTPLIDHLPPVIRIANPADGAHVSNNTVTLNYAVRSPSGQPIDRLDLIINGRPVKSFGLPIKPLAPNAESTGSIPVTLTQHVSQVGLIAWSGDLSSQAAQVEITWDGAPAVTRKLYALVIGVSNYADPVMRLKYAAKDAGDFAAALAAQKGLYYADVQARVLTDRAVTRASIIQGLQWLEKMATNPNDVTVLFLAGHGMTDEKQTYWFYTSDSNDDTVLINGVSQDEIRKSLQGLCGKVLWFLDTCHAGAAAKRSPVDVNVLVNTVSASENGGIVVFASSTGRQVSVESADLGNGAFTKAVIEGLALGKAALGNGFVTTSTLDSYVTERVEQFTGDQQTPVMERPPEEPDFAIAEVRKP